MMASYPAIFPAFPILFWRNAPRFLRIGAGAGTGKEPLRRMLRCGSSVCAVQEQTLQRRLHCFLYSLFYLTFVCIDAIWSLGKKEGRKPFAPIPMQLG
jgi:hypothetical protein